MVELENIGLVVARKWIAGIEIKDAVDRCKKVNEKGAKGVVNFLGEDIKEKKRVDATVDTYIELINQLRAKRANADITVKPTQLGLSISYKMAEKNYLKIVEHAKRKRMFVWFDMEMSDTVDDTIKLYNAALKKYRNVGVCIQSSLKRSRIDLERMDPKAIIRLVKGAYIEAPDITFRDRSKTTENYVELMSVVFKKFKEFTIGTHDPNMIQRAMKLNERYNRKVTYSVLLGIRNKEAFKMARDGNTVSIYIPFGPDWLAYATRRMEERDSAKLIIRSMFD